jgi:hypothetical protein
MTPAKFIETWSSSELRERQGAQSHFSDLCRLLGEPRPTEDDPRLPAEHGLVLWRSIAQTTPTRHRVPTGREGYCRGMIVTSQDWARCG